MSDTNNPDSSKSGSNAVSSLRNPSKPVIYDPYGNKVSAEAKTEDLDPSYFPWRVELNVQHSEYEDDTTRPVYFVRARTGSDAGAIAAWLWERWEKNNMGYKGAKYPDVLGHASVLKADEQDFMSAWHSVRDKELRVRAVGDPANPYAFTCLGVTF